MRWPSLILVGFEPLHVARDAEHVLLGRGGAQDHRLQRDGVGFVEFEAAEVVERLLDVRIVGGHAGVEECERAERR